MTPLGSQVILAGFFFLGVEGGWLLVARVGGQVSVFRIRTEADPSSQRPRSSHALMSRNAGGNRPESLAGQMV